MTDIAVRALNGNGQPMRAAWQVRATPVTADGSAPHVTAGGELIGPVTAITDPFTGRATVTLLPRSAVTPAGTKWRVECGPWHWNINVPDTGTPDVGDPAIKADITVPPPPTWPDPASMATGAQLATESTARVAGDVALGARIDGLPAGGGGGGGVPSVHAPSHATDGTDPVSPASIGAATAAALTAEATTARSAEGTNASAIAGKAADSAVVHNTGAETVAGVKTFSAAPVVPAGAYPESAVTGLTADLAAKLSANDPSVTNARTPTAHAASHASGGTDAATVAESQVTGLTADLVARLVIAQNLADLANAGTARTNLGLGTAATANTGIGAANAVLGNDARLADVRTPADGSVTDAKVAAGAAIAETKLVLASDAATGVASRRTLGTGATQAAAGSDARLSDQRTPLDGSVTTAKVVDGAVTLAKLATVATATIRGRTSAGTGAPEDLTPAQAKTVLGITEADVTGLVADLLAKRALTAYPSGTPASWVNPVRTAATSSAAGSQSRLLASTFEHLANQQITAVRIYVSTAAAASSLRIGIWNCDAYGRPTTLLSELGVIATTTAGWQTLTLGSTLTLTDTRSVLGAVAQGGTPTVATISPAYEPWYSVVPSTNGGAPATAVNAWGVASVTGALPANFPNYAGTAPSSTIAPEALNQSTVPLVQFLAA